MLPGDRLVCVLVDPTSCGVTFSVWPLHVTVIPWFRVGTASGALIKGLRQKLRDIEPFAISIDGEAHFGYQGRKLVSLVNLPSTLILIEQQVRQFLKERGAWIVDETTRHPRPYIPHVTAQADKRLTSGNSFLCDKLYLVEQQGQVKQVVGIVELAR